MQITFYKYEGTGNDFVMVDNRQDFFPKNDILLVKKLCDRRFGIGGDGLILLEKDAETDFKMVYYNSDGNLSSMCGNGGRCIVAFAKRLKIIQNETAFRAIDGLHHATILNDNIVALQMKEVKEIKTTSAYTYLDTGSPHHNVLVDRIENIDIKTLGAQIRYSDLYGNAGSNVNFVKQISESTFAIRTYERGVEDETLSCGTGATAVAIAMNAIGNTNLNTIQIVVQGGNLEVSFEKHNGVYSNVFLKGPARSVFKGTIEC